MNGSSYCKSEKKPDDIPSSPKFIYAEAGWAGIGDWLGTGRRRGGSWRPFKKARGFARRLGLKSHTEWRGYCKSSERPNDIPSAPHLAYADAGWLGYGDWLGTGVVGTRSRRYRPFRKARAFVRRLGLKSRDELSEHYKSGKKPADIPANPYRIYANAGWVGMGDWLGTGRVANQLRRHRSFKKARAFVRGLDLKSGAEWRDYCKSGKKPGDIPTAPDVTYAEAGWAGMGDWLDTDTVASYLRPYRPFKKARAFVRRLGLKSKDEWYEYCKSGKKPADIPASPRAVYAEAGWAGWGDWLGGTVAARLRRYRPFRKARAFVRRLGLKSREEWSEYCKLGKKPADIPSNARVVYAKAGWAGIGDWLGTKRRGMRWRPFKKARAFVRGLDLKSTNEWFDYCKSDKKPNDIPSNPNKNYTEDGWSDWGDWLRTTRRHGGWRPFTKARAYVRGLGLKSQTEWFDYSKSDKKPNDIPAAPFAVYAEDGWSDWGDWLGNERQHSRPDFGSATGP